MSTFRSSPFLLLSFLLLLTVALSVFFVSVLAGRRMPVFFFLYVVDFGLRPVF